MRDQKKLNFYKVKKFSPSEFKCIEADLEAVKSMGKLVNNSLNETPLVLFNTQRFAAY